MITAIADDEDDEEDGPRDRGRDVNGSRRRTRLGETE